jgi:hypothetical protein
MEERGGLVATKTSSVGIVLAILAALAGAYYNCDILEL